MNYDKFFTLWALLFTGTNKEGTMAWKGHR